MNKKLSFGENLKFYREKMGYTQRFLAQMLGYSEKSVSKWESGNGYPTLETLTCLSEIFSVSLDTLLYAKPERYYFLGIDGGGTSTVFRLAECDGAVVRTIVKDCCNPVDIGMEQSKKILAEGIREICGEISYSHISMYAGISGGGMSGDNAVLLREFFQTFGFFQFDNGSDVENVLALLPEDSCILVIMGTGFIAYCIGQEYRKRIAGWGQLFDRGGSGYTIGADGITASLRHLDGSGRPTQITQMLTQRIGQTPEQHLTRFYAGGKKYIASFADVVFAAAGQGDLAAMEILQENMAFVAQMVETAQSEFSQPVPVYFSGGISKCHDTLFPMIRKHLSREMELIPLEQEPVSGAVNHAARLFERTKEGI